jgi:hypothetical protein
MTVRTIRRGAGERRHGSANGNASAIPASRFAARACDAFEGLTGVVKVLSHDGLAVNDRGMQI